MESPSLTPSGGEFLSQLGKTWNLIQSKAKELDKAKKKQRKTDEELMARLISSGLEGNMDEINSLENRVLRGKIKAAIMKEKRKNNG